MSIIRLIQSRGYLPTCRILHLLLWMQSEVSASPSKKNNRRDHFIDIGANIGSCTTHIAALGYPVISAEPVTEHIKTIQGIFNQIIYTIISSLVFNILYNMLFNF